MSYEAVKVAALPSLHHILKANLYLPEMLWHILDPVGASGLNWVPNSAFVQLAGGAVLAVGMWTLLEKSSYISLLNSNFYSASAYILIAAGAIVIVTGIIGCCATLKEIRSLLIVVRCTQNSPLWQRVNISLSYSTTSNQKLKKDTLRSCSCAHNLAWFCVHWKLILGDLLSRLSAFSAAHNVRKAWLSDITDKSCRVCL